METHRQTTVVWLPEGRGWGMMGGKSSQIYSDGRWFNFGWWTHNAVYRACTTEMYT